MTKRKAKAEPLPIPLNATIVKVTVTLAVQNYLCDEHKTTINLVAEQMSADDRVLEMLTRDDEIAVLGYESALLKLGYQFPT